MPYKIETDKIKLPRHLDRRVKLTDEQREEIKELHKRWISQRALARQFKVSRRLISFIVHPEKLERARELYKERRKDWRYYDREKHTKQIRETRRYRQSVLWKK